MTIAETFSRSWDITKQTFHVMKLDKEIMLFPILSGITSLILFAIFLFPLFVFTYFGKMLGQVGVLLYVGIFVFYFLVTFTSIFFNAGMVHIAKTRFSKGDATFKDGIKAAASHFKQLIAWSLLSATVGLILSHLQAEARERGGIAGFIAGLVISLIGIAWAIVSVFVVPAIVLKGYGPIDALKSSALAIKKTWGESLIRYYGLGMVQGICTFVNVILFLVPALILLFFGQSWALAGPLLGVFVLIEMLIIIVFNSANTIFNTALFMYADTGKVPHHYSEDTMKNAFKQKTGRI